MLDSFQRVAAAVPDVLPAVLEVAGAEVVLFALDGRYFAVSRWCPHRGADLVAGYCLGTSVKCPHHGFSFDLETGLGISHPGQDLDAYEVRVQDDGVYLRKQSARSSSTWG